MPDKVTDPKRIVTDPVLLSNLRKRGIDPDYVEFTQDYASPFVDGKRVKGRSPYAKFYRDLKSNKRFGVFSGLPMVDADGLKVDVGWEKQGNKFTEKNNLFKCTVQDTQVEIKVKNDQPDGRKKNDKLNYHAQLFLDGVEQTPSAPVLLPVDPVNENYQNNVLEWDYGVCKRRLRLIQGRILGSWVFESNPLNEVRIKYNQKGDFKLKLGQFKSGDEELIPLSVFNEAEYPFTVSDSPETFYPDTGGAPGDTSLRAEDTGVSWSTLHDRTTSPGLQGYDAQDSHYGNRLESGGETDTYTYLYRNLYCFDTSGLPDDVTITEATFSVYGVAKTDTLEVSPTVNIFGTTSTHTTGAFDVEDFGRFGTTPFCDTPIAYADWKVADPFWNDFALNATGLEAVSKTSITRLGTREATYDATDTPPAWASGKKFYLANYAAEKGEGYKPKLVVTYTVAAAPTVTTQAASDIAATAATGNGNITDTGGENCDHRGIVYDTSSHGDPGNTAPGDSDYANYEDESGDFGTGAFTRSLTGLGSPMRYYARAYAHNSEGYSYSDEITFITHASASVSVGVVATASRAMGANRSSSVIAGVLVSATKSWGRILSSAVSVGILAAATRILGAPRSAAVSVGVAVSASVSWGKVISSSVIVGIVTTASRAVGMIRSSSVIAGIVATASRVIGATRSSSVYVGVVATATRALSATRSAVVSVGAHVSAAGRWGRVVSAATSVGVLVSAIGVFGWLALSSVRVGVAVTASRIASVARSASVSVGVVATASRIAGMIKSASVSIGALVSVTRIAGVSRSASVIIGIVANASRIMGTTCSASVQVGAVATASRLAGVIRSASVAVGILTSAVRAVTTTRAASVIIGIAATASRAVGAARASSVIVGVVATASRAIAITRSASVSVGVVASATPNIGRLVISSVLVGVVSTASKAIGIVRSAATSVGAAVSAFRAIGITRSSAVSVGIVATASRLMAAIRSASVSIGVTTEFPMAQIIIGGLPGYQTLKNGTVYYSLRAGLPPAEFGGAAQVICSPGQLGSFYVRLSAAPGEGSSYTFTIQLNGVDTDITCTVSDSDTTASDLVHTALVEAGDLVAVKEVSSGTPAGGSPTYTCKFTGVNSYDSLLLGNCGGCTHLYATRYNALLPVDLYAWTDDETARYQICPTTGTIRNFRVNAGSAATGDPTAGFRITLRKNLEDTAITVDLMCGETIVNDLEHEVSVSAGDKLSLKMERLNSPTSATGRIRFGFTFTSDIPGECIALGNTISSLETSSIAYHSFECDATVPWYFAEYNAYQLAQSCRFKKLYVELNDAPGSGKSYTFQSRISGATGNLSVVIDGANKTGNDTNNIDTVGDGVVVDLMCTPSGSPASTKAHWGMVVSSPYTGIIINIVRSASTIVGVLVSASRAIGIIRSASVAAGIVATASRTLSALRSASVSVGVAVSASRAIAVARSAAVSVGVVVSAVRTFGAVRSSSVIVGVVATASRTFGALRSASVSVGAVATASRTMAAIRSAAVSVGAVASATISKPGKVFRIETITSQYRKIKTITSQYRKIRTKLSKQ